VNLMQTAKSLVFRKTDDKEIATMRANALPARGAPPYARRLVSRAHPLAATRRRLLAMNLLVVSGILAIMALAVYGWELHASDQQVNEQLTGWVNHESQSDLIVTTSQGWRPETHDALDNAERYEPSSPNVFSIGLDQQGRVVFDPGNVHRLGLPDLTAAWPVLHGQRPNTLITVGDDTNAYRLYTVPITSHGQIVGALQVGLSLAARERQLHDLRLILAGVGAGVLLLTLFGSLYLADRALQPMQRAYDRQRQFAAAASHELRTPLAIVRSQAELIERALMRTTAQMEQEEQEEQRTHETHNIYEGSEAEKIAADTNGKQARARLQAAQGDLRDLFSEVDYMARLVHDLLILARDEGDQHVIAANLVNLSALAEETVSKLAPQATANGITLHMDVLQEDGASEVTPDSSGIFVRGDSDRLRQLLIVLLENALRYTPSEGNVQVHLSKVHGHFLLRHRYVAQIEITDTGIGIAPEHLPHIFEPFYRAQSVPGGAAAQPASVGGAGLGLALARWIVTAHGGEMTVASTVGAGTCFTITLPCAESDAPVQVTGE